MRKRNIKKRTVLDLRYTPEGENSVASVTERVAEFFDTNSNSEIVVAVDTNDLTLIKSLCQRIGSKTIRAAIRPSDTKQLFWRYPEDAALHTWITRDLDREFIASLLCDEIAWIDGRSKKFDRMIVDNTEEPTARRKLAVISPLPPEQTGVADYVAGILPHLSHWYQIDVVSNQKTISDTWILENCNVLSYQEFRNRASNYERVLSHYHADMFEMLEDVPGVVTLHDFFLGDVQNQRERQNPSKFSFTREIYRSHGYRGLIERSRTKNLADFVARFPSNHSVVQNALGTVVHSEYAQNLAAAHYGSSTVETFTYIPLMRVVPKLPSREEARAELGLSDDCLIVCSFGFLGESKLNRELLEAWSLTQLASNSTNRLFFVGKSGGGPYNEAFHRELVQPRNKGASVTGWVDAPTYNRYLAAADIGIQLRRNSRGETSAAALDCLVCGIPLIVNDHGYATELPRDFVTVIPEHFDVYELSAAIDNLAKLKERRQEISRLSRNWMDDNNSSAVCSQAYRRALENFYCSGLESRLHENRAIGSLSSIAQEFTGEKLAHVAVAISDVLPTRSPAPQILIDVTILSQTDLHTGIQRVVKALVLSMINEAHLFSRIEPVALTDTGGAWHYRYARKWTSELLELPTRWAEDNPVELNPGDVFLGADFIGEMASRAAKAGLYSRMSARGVEVNFVVYDLLPITMPSVFPPEGWGFQNWLKAVACSSDRLLCISQTVVRDVVDWMLSQQIEKLPMVEDFPLGDDIQNAKPTSGLPDYYESLIAKISKCPTFLMVGTIEPRKGYLQTIVAFEYLWRKGIDANLVIVGQEGWRGIADEDRRTIPEIVRRLTRHVNKNVKLFWICDASDELLTALYSKATCLLAASEGEGFGLPLVEAASYNLPVLARDLPVFKEVMGESAYYFHASTAEELSIAIANWLDAYETESLPSTKPRQSRDWSASARTLISMLSLKVANRED